jgi:hypothetical protein
MSLRPSRCLACRAAPARSAHRPARAAQADAALVRARDSAAGPGAPPLVSPRALEFRLAPGYSDSIAHHRSAVRAPPPRPLVLSGHAASLTPY